jgi:Tfp pilus assembly protein PilO
MPLQIKLLILLVVAAAVGYYSWDTHISEAEGILTQAKQADEQLDNEIRSASSNGGQTASTLEQQMRTAEAEFTSLFELLPKEVDIDRLLSIFSDSARETGVLLRRFTPQDGDRATNTPPALTPPGALPPNNSAPKAKGNAGSGGLTTFSLDSLKKVNVTIEAEGSYVQLASFIDRILNAPRIIKIDNLKFSPGTQIAVGQPSAPGGNPTLKLAAVFISYVQKPGIAPPNLASAVHDPAPPMETPPSDLPAVEPPAEVQPGAQSTSPSEPPPPQVQNPPAEAAPLTLPPQGGN